MKSEYLFILIILQIAFIAFLALRTQVKINRANNLIKIFFKKPAPEALKDYMECYELIGKLREVLK